MPQIRVIAGERPNAFAAGTDEAGATVLVCRTGTVRIEGTLEERRRAARAMAEAAGLHVVDEQQSVVMPESYYRDRDNLRTT